MTLQLNEIASLEGKITKSFRRKSYYLKTQQKLVIKPNTQEVSNCIIAFSELPEGTCAVVEPLSNFEKQTGLCLTSSLAQLDSAEKTQQLINQLSFKPFCLDASTSPIKALPNVPGRRLY